MRKIILIVSVVAIASANILAQEPPPRQDAPKKTPEERADNMTKRITKELSLTTDQQAKVKALVLKREQDREDHIKEGKAEHEKMDADLQLILTAEQYQLYQQKREEMKKKREEKQMAPQNSPPPPPPAPAGK